MSSSTVSFPDCSATCPRVVELEEENRELKEKLAVKDERIERLRNKLRKHENPHVPSSQKCGTTKAKDRGDENDDGGDEDVSGEEDGSSQEKLGDENGGRGRNGGHDGETRKKPEPDRTVVVLEERCSNCGRELGDPDWTRTEIVEDIPNPGSVKAVEYEIGHYECECGEETVATHEDIPEKGNFGPNVLTQTTLLKFQERVPYGKIQNLFEDVYELQVSTNTLYSFTGRVADQLRPFYEEIRQKVRRCESVHCDETGVSLEGENGWVWTTTTESEVLYNVREDRSQKALEHMLGENYSGTIVCDGWRSYSAYSSNLQRCWSHLLNESEFTADKHHEAVPIDEKLHKIYKDLKKFLEEDPPPDRREERRKKARKELEDLVNQNYENDEVQELVNYIENGMDYWLTFVTNPEVEPTNNRAERSLRKIVTLRKIIGTIRSERGRYILETIMTAIETWKARGQNPHKEMQKILRTS
ncbi:hypothetical protein AKJ64_04465 [candidate division MSBL1 archaeon SCGC-AAA259E17]|uniref:Transposase IS66 central domain-containing protein n=1 Tax=candidate division MSBL1 archaeon SCGC-AAA259E17 TaxID=1698263 RepID=A0A133UC91_9EURY|nr:hypothetical protein AKJ64_04465 [candidate division MSBL1 archaeon SCGC-AAA259E17]